MQLRGILLDGLVVFNNSVLTSNLTGAISYVLYFFRHETSFSSLTICRLEERGTCNRGGGQGQGEGEGEANGIKMF